MLMSEYFRNSAPAPEAVLNEMFEFLAIKLNPEITERPALSLDTILNATSDDDDDAYRYTREFSQGHGLDEEEIIAWMEGEFGACDDCTVLELVAIWYMQSSYDPVIGEPDPYHDPEQYSRGYAPQPPRRKKYSDPNQLNLFSRAKL